MVFAPGKVSGHRNHLTKVERRLPEEGHSDLAKALTCSAHRCPLPTWGSVTEVRLRIREGNAKSGKGGQNGRE
jgi:hypothetical protein